MRQIFLDTETTGLNPEAGDRIIEIGCIEMVNRRLTGNNLHRYVNPQRPSHEDAVKVHGLTDEFLADKPLFGAIADELMEFLAGAEIVIHNAAFDIGFLNAELRRLGKAEVTTCVANVCDSLQMARDMFPGKSNSLDALCRRLEVDNSNRTLHGALLDAGLLAEVYLRLTRGQNSLAIDAGDDGTGQWAVAAIDFSVYTLRVIVADANEVAAHEALLTELDKASAGKTRWRQLESAAVA
ncbi:MAG: DNA polymerase III subunit epsilon [Ideonella sp.]